MNLMQHTKVEYKEISILLYFVISPHNCSSFVLFGIKCPRSAICMHAPISFAKPKGQAMVFCVMLNSFGCCLLVNAFLLINVNAKNVGEGNTEDPDTAALSFPVEIF